MGFFLYADLIISPYLQLELNKSKMELYGGPSSKVLKIFVECKDVPETIAELRKLGITPQSIAGSILSIHIPLEKFEELKKINSIQKIEMGPPLKPLNDIGCDMINADIAWQGGYTGEDVIIGIIDTGVDFTHPTFKDSSGNTRILYLWDQTDNQSGTPPSGFTYGTEYTAEDIDAGRCNQKDVEGHGTHIAATAAGGESPYFGVCKCGKNIIAVKTDMTEQGLLDGINYIFQKASSLDKPAIVNVSLGSLYGPHDGTSSFCKAVDSLIGPGRIVVFAAGNWGNEAVHSEATVSATINIGFTVSDNLQGTDCVDIYGKYDYSAANSVSIQIKSPNENTYPSIGGVEPGDSFSQQTSDGYISISNTTDGEILIELSDGNSPLAEGTWTIIVSPKAGSPEVDFYVADYGPNVESYFNDHVDYNETLSDQATTSTGICVAALVSRTSWKNYLGNEYGLAGETLGQICSFSSKGPARNGSQKPDVCAPGALIISAASADASYSDENIIEQNKWVGMAGTSMSAPFVTGGLGIILQINPSWGPTEVLNYIKNYSASNTYITAGTWNESSGWGIFDLSCAVGGIIQAIWRLPNSIRLLCQTFVPANSITLQMKEENSTEWQDVTEVETEQEVTIDGLSPNQNYEFRLKIVTTKGETIYSPKTYIHTLVAKQEGSSDVFILNNVAKRGQTVQLVLTSNITGEIYLVDRRGFILKKWKKEAGVRVINIETTLVPGLYVVLVKTSNKIYRRVILITP